MSKIKAKNTLYNDPRYDVVVDSRMLEQHLKEKDQQIAELKKQLEEKEEEIEELQKDYEFKDKDCAINLERFCDALTKNVQLEFLIKDLQSELKTQPAEIVEKINGEIYTRMVVECKETKYTDINLILNNILKEYQK